MVRLTDHLDMTIVVDAKLQKKQTNIIPNNISVISG